MNATHTPRFPTVEVQTQARKGARWGVQAIYTSESSAADEVARWKARGVNVRTVVKRPPGPWVVSEWQGGEGHRAGFYVSRTGTNGHTEWMMARTKARRFADHEEARAAIAQATGGAA